VKQQESSCAFQNQCSFVKCPHHQFHQRFMGCNDILLLFWSRIVSPTWQVVGTPRSSSLANNHQELHTNTIRLEPKTFGCPKVPKGVVHILLTFVWVMETNLLSNQCRSIECTHHWCHQRFMGCNVIHTGVACAIAPSVTTSSMIFPSKTWFFEIYLKFQWQKSLRNQYLPHSESKSYQINSIKSCSSRSFQQHQRHIPIPPKISTMI